MPFLHLLLNPLNIGALHVHLIDSNHEDYFGVERMLQGLVGLGHEAVIRRHHEYRNIRDRGAARAHFGKSGVTRRIEESYFVAVMLDLVSSNVLRNAPRLPRGYIRFTDGIQQGSFSMVDVTENANHGRTRSQILDIFFARFFRFVNFDDLGRDGRHNGFAAVLDVEEEAMLFRDLSRNRLIDGLIHRGEDFHLHQFRDQFERFQAERDGEFADNNRRLQMNDLNPTLFRNRDGRGRGRSRRRQLRSKFSR